jgi:hypothetical protein
LSRMRVALEAIESAAAPRLELIVSPAANR